MKKEYLGSAARIKTLRKRANLSQKELAKRLGIATTTVSSWEQAVSQPPLKRAKALAKILHTDPNYLLGADNKKTDNPKGIKYVDLKTDPVVLSYGGKPVTKEDLSIIRAILGRHKNE